MARSARARRCSARKPRIAPATPAAASSHTQSGVGSALFRATRERALALGLTAINATIRADNAGGLAFYSRQGFRDHSVAKAVPLSDGTPVDRISKRYSLMTGRNG